KDFCLRDLLGDLVDVLGGSGGDRLQDRGHCQRSGEGFRQWRLAAQKSSRGTRPAEAGPQGGAPTECQCSSTDAEQKISTRAPAHTSSCCLFQDPGAAPASVCTGGPADRRARGTATATASMATPRWICRLISRAAPAPFCT